MKFLQILSIILYLQLKSRACLRYFVDLEMFLIVFNTGYCKFFHILIL